MKPKFYRAADPAAPVYTASSVSSSVSAAAFASNTSLQLGHTVNPLPRQSEQVRQTPSTTLRKPKSLQAEQGCCPEPPHVSHPSTPGTAVVVLMAPAGESAAPSASSSSSGRSGRLCSSGNEARTRRARAGCALRPRADARADIRACPEYLGAGGPLANAGPPAIVSEGMECTARSTLRSF